MNYPTPTDPSCRRGETYVSYPSGPARGFHVNKKRQWTAFCAKNKFLRRERGIQAVDGSRTETFSRSRSAPCKKEIRSRRHRSPVGPGVKGYHCASFNEFSRLGTCELPTPNTKSRSILPMRADWIQNLFVSARTAFEYSNPVWRRSPSCMILQFQRHDMPRVPDWRERPPAILASVLPLGDLLSPALSSLCGGVPPGDFQEKYEYQGFFSFFPTSMFLNK